MKRIQGRYAVVAMALVLAGTGALANEAATQRGNDRSDVRATNPADPRSEDPSAPNVLNGNVASSRNDQPRDTSSGASADGKTRDTERYPSTSRNQNSADEPSSQPQSPGDGNLSTSGQG